MPGYPYSVPSVICRNSLRKARSRRETLTLVQSPMTRSVATNFLQPFFSNVTVCRRRPFLQTMKIRQQDRTLARQLGGLVMIANGRPSCSALVFLHRSSLGRLLRTPGPRSPGASFLPFLHLRTVPYPSLHSCSPIEGRQASDESERGLLTIHNSLSRLSLQRYLSSMLTCMRASASLSFRPRLSS
jgi:hypothetical protein